MNGSKTIGIQDQYVHLMLKEIQKRGSACIGQLREIGSWRTLDVRLRFMMEKGLVVSFIRERGRRVNLYRLTDKGCGLLLLLDMGEGIVEGNIDVGTGRFTEGIGDLTLETLTEASFLSSNGKTVVLSTRRRTKNE